MRKTLRLLLLMVCGYLFPSSVYSQYCSSTSLSSSVEYISNVNVGAYNNATGRSNYANYYATGAITTVMPGSSFQCLVTITDPITVLDEIYIYGDFNHDNDFNDAGENPAGFSLAPTAGVFTVTVNIPPTAIPGPTYIRIKMGDPDNGTPLMTADPCQATFYYGEVEDYQIMVGTLSPCSGAPAASNTISSANPACPSTNFTLSLSTYYGNLSGISYQWQRSADSGFTSPTALGTASTQVTSQTVNSYYRCLIICSGQTIISAPVYVSTSGPCYCVPSGSNSAYFINNFSTTGGITNINNLSSGYSATGYGVFTAMTVSQFAGQPINYSANFISAIGTFGFGIWVDWNSNGVFEVPSEQVFSSAAYVSNPTGSFTVPAGQALGNYRMRICANYWATSPVPCAVGITGEYEDYTLSVVALTACVGSPVSSNTIASSAAVCTGNAVNFSLSVNYNNLSGISYQWQRSTDGITYNNVSATTATYSTSLSATTWVRCIVSCANGGAQTFSIPVQVTVGAPQITSVNGAQRCGTGSVTLTATGTGSQINWYNAFTGGTFLGTGSSFATPPIAVNTTYYAEPQSGASCLGTRVAVTATINPSISALSVNPATSTNCSNTVLAITATGGVSQGAATVEHAKNFDFNMTGYSTSGTGVTATWITSPVFEGSGAMRLNYTSSSNGSCNYTALAPAPMIDLSTAASATLSFSHICALEGSSTAYDKGFVQYSTDAGATWEDFTPSDYMGSGALLNGVVAFSTTSYTDWRNNIIQSTSTFANNLWKTELINIPAGGFTADFRIRFLITSDASVSYPGWFIDDIKIIKYATGSQQNITWSPVTGLYTDAGATTAYTAGTNATTVYSASTNSITYSASSINGSGCYTSANSVITINGPSLLSAPNADRCGTGPITLNATATSGQTINWYTQPTGGSVLFTGASYTVANLTTTTTYYASAGSPNSSSIVFTGNGASSSNSVEYNPYKYSGGSRKTQFMITAAELATMMGTNVNINSISFDVMDAGAVLNNFEIRLSNVNNGSIGSNAFENAATTLVYSAATTTPVVGVNTYAFTPNFTRIVGQDLFITVCWNNNNSGGTPTPRIKYDNTGHFSSAYAEVNNGSACGLNNHVSRFKRRPRIGLGVVSSALCFGPRIPVIATIKPVDTWIGVNSNWNDPLNWCPGVPTITTNVSIPIVSSGIYPILTNGQTAYCNNISIATGGPMLTLNSGAAMETHGNFSNNGILNNSGRINLKGAADQSFPGTGTINSMAVLAIDKTGGTVQVNNHFFIDSALLPFARTLGLNNYNITLRSNSSKTTYVGAVGLNAGFTYGTGNFIVERYISYTRKWQLLSVPAITTQSIRDSWQNNGVYSAGVGVNITGPLLSNGLDAPTSNTASMKYQAGTSQNFTPITVTNTPGTLQNPKGYYLFVYGDRSATSGTIAGPPTTIKTTGKLFVGNGGAGEQPPTVSAIATPVLGEDHMSVGNPFASPIDFNILRTNNASGNYKTNFKVWDPSQLGAWDAGIYQTISETAAGQATPGGGNIYSAGSSFNHIQSGQAFYVEATNPGTVNVSFSESIKSSTQRLANRAEERDPLQLSMISAFVYNNSGTLLDGNRVVLDDQYAHEVDVHDAGKLWNEGANLAILKNNRSLAVEGRPTLQASDTIQYELYGLYNGNYQLQLAMQQINAPNLQGLLVDRYLNSSTPVSLADSSFINFSINNDPASSSANRFYLVFKAISVVPVNFIYVKANWINDHSSSIQWKVAHETSILKYEVERSTDAIAFNNILDQDATNSSIYTKTDGTPNSINNFYRIKAIGQNADVSYSETVRLYKPGSASIKVQPNPVRDGLMFIYFKELPLGNYTIQLINQLGQRVYSNPLFISQDVTNKKLQLKKIAKGSYTVVIRNEAGVHIHAESILIK